MMSTKVSFTGKTISSAILISLLTLALPLPALALTQYTYRPSTEWVVSLLIQLLIFVIGFVLIVYGIISFIYFRIKKVKVLPYFTVASLAGGLVPVLAALIHTFASGPIVKYYVDRGLSYDPVNGVIRSIFGILTALALGVIAAVNIKRNKTLAYWLIAIAGGLAILYLLCVILNGTGIATISNNPSPDLCPFCPTL